MYTHAYLNMYISMCICTAPSNAHTEMYAYYNSIHNKVHTHNNITYMHIYVHNNYTVHMHVRDFNEHLLIKALKYTLLTAFVNNLSLL